MTFPVKIEKLLDALSVCLVDSCILAAGQAEEQLLLIPTTIATKKFCSYLQEVALKSYLAQSHSDTKASDGVGSGRPCQYRTKSLGLPFSYTPYTLGSILGLDCMAPSQAVTRFARITGKDEGKIIVGPTGWET
eukprot:scaffold4603_cov175-Amphora_coffeaeformis.AAC.9